MVTPETHGSVTVPESVQFDVQLAVTVKVDPLLAVPNTVTTTLPVVAPAGTVTVRLLALGEPLLAVPPTVTTTLPVVAPTGTAIVILVALHELATPADNPLNVTVLVLCDAPKLVPVMVIEVPTDPDV
jgi:hypothetical protein